MTVTPDLALFGVDEARRLTDDRYFIFYNQLRSPEGALILNEQTQAFSIDLNRIPLGLHRLILAATSDDQAFSVLGRGHVSLEVNGRELVRFEVDGSMFAAERAVMLLELYRHQGEWRLAGVGQGFSGGLQSLLESLGGEVLQEEAPPPSAPATAPPPASRPTPSTSEAWPRLRSLPPHSTSSNACRRCGTPSGLLHRMDAQGLCRSCARATQKGLEHFRVRFQAACADGIMERHEWDDLQHTVEVERIDAQQALTFVRPEAVRILERTVASARASGTLEPDEEESFHRLRRLLEVPDSMVLGPLADLAELKTATAIRSGQLPTVRSVLILESGEIAHLEAPATYRHVTASRTRDIHGRLTVTSKQLRFTTPSEGGWDVQYGKVLRIEEVPGGVSLELGVKKGGGLYRVERPLLLGATLDALVRLHKRLMLMPQTERASRHIPQDVKNQVWHQDQGSCRECGDNNYLEFDHVIPFSKGGASTVGNLQLLCRKCNLKKGDRL